MNNVAEYKAIVPGLVINVTDECNFHCVYCPPFGENLCKGLGQYDENAVISVIKLAQSKKLPMVRITGGEPFIEPERVRLFLAQCGDSFDRLVINTNGSLVGKHLDWLEKYKGRFVLKFSLDSLSPECFCRMSKSNAYSVVIDNLITTIEHGFNIEVNCVILHQSFEDLREIVNFVIAHNIHCKFLTVSAFHGTVDECSSRSVLLKLIQYLRELSAAVSETRLVGGRGGTMLLYTIENSNISIFDHSVAKSVTPKRTYFSLCEHGCNMYPCDSGAISVNISTDGILSACRGRKDLGEQIFFRSHSEIESAFVKQLRYYESCFSIDVNTRQRI